MIPLKNRVFVSKRNNCYYHAEQQCVIKEFLDRSSYFVEKDMYICLNDKKIDSVPKLISYDDTTLTLHIEYIEGPLLLVMLELCEKNNNVEKAVELLEKVIVWLQNFYTLNIQDKSNIIFGDVNLRNFIVRNNSIVAIDFEKSVEGDSVEEINYLVAMYMLYNPINTIFKQEVLDILSKKQHLNKDDIKLAMKGISERRYKSIK